MIQGSNPNTGKIFLISKCPDQLWGPPSQLFSGCQGTFQGWSWLYTSIYCQSEEWVQQYFWHPIYIYIYIYIYMPSRSGEGKLNLSFTFLCLCSLWWILFREIWILKAVFKNLKNIHNAIIPLIISKCHKYLITFYFIYFLFIFFLNFW